MKRTPENSIHPISDCLGEFDKRFKDAMGGKLQTQSVQKDPQGSRPAQAAALTAEIEKHTPREIRH